MRIYQINSDMRFLHDRLAGLSPRQLFQNIINHALPQFWGLAPGTACWPATMNVGTELMLMLRAASFFWRTSRQISIRQQQFARNGHVHAASI